MFSRPLVSNASRRQGYNIMTGDEATIDLESTRYTEPAQKLMTSESGVFQSGNGLKMNATKVRVLGGGDIEIIGAMLINGLLHKEESISQMAKNIWLQIFSRDPSSNERENVTIVAEFSTKLDRTHSDQKVMLQTLINRLQEDLTKALKEKNPQALSDRLEDIELKSTRLSRHTQLLQQVTTTELTEGSKEKIKGKIETITQTIQRFSSETETNSEHIDHRAKEHKNEVDSTGRDMLSESFFFDATVRQTRIEVEKELRNEFASLLEKRKPDNLVIRRLIKKYHGDFKDRLRKKFPDPFYSDWLESTFFKEYSYFFSDLTDDFRKRRENFMRGSFSENRQLCHSTQ